MDASGTTYCAAMEPLPLLLVLAAATLSAGWNRLVHDSADKVAVMGVSGIVSALVLLPMTIAHPPWAVWPLILLSAAFETVYSLALSAAYHRGELSLAYPLGRGAAPLLVTLGGWIVLAERPAPLPLLGAALLGLGLGLLSHAGWRAGRAAAVGFALLAGMAIGGYSVVDARAVRQVDPAAYLGPVLGLQGAAICLFSRWPAGRLRASLRPSLVVGIASIVAYLLVLHALRIAPAGRVATVREISVLIGILLARERPGGWIWAGAVGCVAGAILAAW
jgi:drug/metabolite transporter (DMT)-like permease